MFEQTSRLAEKLAASVSRRGFLGTLLINGLARRARVVSRTLRRLRAVAT